MFCLICTNVPVVQIRPSVIILAQVEREACALVFGLKYFHNYLWGQPKFTVVTDHKPLLGIFNNSKPISAMASGRIQRWALMLQSYSFDLVHKSGTKLGTADTL